MKRREFLRNAAAATLTPLVPTRAAAGVLPTISAEHYARAVRAATHWAYVSSNGLKYLLGVDDATSRELVRRLQSSGILGEVGVNGLAVSERCIEENRKAIAQAFDAAAKTRAAAVERKRARRIADDLEAAPPAPQWAYVPPEKLYQLMGLPADANARLLDGLAARGETERDLTEPKETPGAPFGHRAIAASILEAG